MRILIGLGAVLLAGILFSYSNSAEALSCSKVNQQKSGYYKICYYSCLGVNIVAIKIKAHNSCRLSISVRPEKR